MSTTAKWVFDRAIHLMDEQNENSGLTETMDTQEYRFRALSILNVLRHELYPISDTFSIERPDKRPICPELQSMEDEIGLDDAVAQGIMPYGLAAHLLLGENNTMANYFSQRYLELYQTLRSTLPATWEDIQPHYGGLQA